MERGDPLKLDLEVASFRYGDKINKDNVERKQLRDEAYGRVAVSFTV